MRPPAILALSLAALAAGSCRGGYSEAPPVHLVLDMDFQPKVKTQSESAFFADRRGMRAHIEDTVARGSMPDPRLLPDPAKPGRDRDGSFLESNPVPATLSNLRRGRERFDIFCAPCHGYSGRGGGNPGKVDADFSDAHGMVGKRWPVAIPSFHASPDPKADNRVPNLKDGEIFAVITEGKGTMPPYGNRILVHDRWCIIHYVRALQQQGKQ
ncbi:MAG: cytochrome c [Planctomycetota bacterium]